ncbi:MAG TPA: hypothetical protein VMM37_02240 [Bacteroidota bacterium]|nr:hypothetical protein [Bacteroidota bacterium]
MAQPDASADNVMETCDNKSGKAITAKGLSTQNVPSRNSGMQKTY